MSHFINHEQPIDHEHDKQFPHDPIRWRDLDDLRGQRLYRASQEVRNVKGEIRRAHATTPEGYRFTVDSMLMTVRHLLEHPEQKGYLTPTMLMGANCVERLPGVSRIALS